MVVHQMYKTTYEAEQVSANAVRLRVIKLKGTSMR